jgi:aminoglycoside 6'-N-acetyltransferase I
MRVRALEPRDVDAWAAMRSALWPEADAEELRREAAAFLIRPRLINAVFVAEAEAGGLVGFVELSLRSHADGCDSSPVPFVEGWYVVPEARRGGVGGALIAAAEAWATAGGYREIASDALIDNLVSIDAHAALGFEEVERDVRFRKSLVKTTR